MLENFFETSFWKNSSDFIASCISFVFAYLLFIIQDCRRKKEEKEKETAEIIKKSKDILQKFSNEVSENKFILDNDVSDSNLLFIKLHTEAWEMIKYLNFIETSEIFIGFARLYHDIEKYNLLNSLHQINPTSDLKKVIEDLLFRLLLHMPSFETLIQREMVLHKYKTKEWFIEEIGEWEETPYIPYVSKKKEVNEEQKTQAGFVKDSDLSD